MSFKFIKDHVPFNQAKIRGTNKTRRPGVKINPTTFTIHSTANPKSTARNERKWLTNPSNKRVASYHYVVDDKEVIEVLPPNEMAYHAGNGVGNRTSLSLEICESGNREKTLRNAELFTAQILHQRGWGVNKLRRHFDWSGKNCPRILNYQNWRGWKTFVSNVDKLLKEMNKPKRDINKVAKWAEPYWKWAIENDVFDGTKPGGPITREQFSKVVQTVIKKGMLD